MLICYVPALLLLFLVFFYFVFLLWLRRFFCFFYLQMLTFHANINVLCCCLFVIYIYIYVWNQGNKYGLNTTQVKISLLKKTGEIKLGGRKKITFSKSAVEQPSRSGQKKVFYFLTFWCNSSFTKKLSTRAESFLTLKPHTKIYFW